MSDVTRDPEHNDEHDMLEEIQLPKVNEFKRFVRVFFRRKSF